MLPQLFPRADFGALRDVGPGFCLWIARYNSKISFPPHLLLDDPVPWRGKGLIAFSRNHYIFHPHVVFFEILDIVPISSSQPVPI